MSLKSQILGEMFFPPKVYILGPRTGGKLSNQVTPKNILNEHACPHLCNIVHCILYTNKWTGPLLENSKIYFSSNKQKNPKSGLMSKLLCITAKISCCKLLDTMIKLTLCGGRNLPSDYPQSPLSQIYHTFRRACGEIQIGRDRQPSNLLCVQGKKASAL